MEMRGAREKTLKVTGSLTGGRGRTSKGGRADGDKRTVITSEPAPAVAVLDGPPCTKMRGERGLQDRRSAPLS